LKAKGDVIAVIAEVSGHLAIAAETEIQGASRQVAREGKVNEAITGNRKSCHHKLAVGLNGQGVSFIKAAAEVGSHLAIAAEACVEISRRCLHQGCYRIVADRGIGLLHTGRPWGRNMQHQQDRKWKPSS
jgi:hypothetical protein